MNLKFWNRKNKEKNGNTIDFENQTFTTQSGKTLNEEVSEEHQLILEKIKSRAKADAQASPCLPYLNISASSGFELELRCKYQSMIALVQSTCEDKISYLEKTCSRLANECTELVKNKAEFIDKSSQKIIKKRNNEESKDNRIFQDKHAALARMIERVIAIIENLYKNISAFEQTLANDYESDFKSRHRTLTFLLIGIGILEIPMNYLLLSLWREGFIGTILLTILFSILIPISAHSFGGLLKKKKSSKKDIFWMTCSVLVALVISAVVGYVRHNYLSDKGVDILNVWGYGALNFILFIVASWLSYHLGFKNPDVVKAVKSAKKSLKKEELNLSTIKEQLYELEEKNAKKQNQLEDQFDDTVNLDFERKYSDMQIKMKSTEKEYSGVLAAVKSLEETINTYFFEATSLYQSTNVKWRNDNSRPAFWDNEIQPLKTFYANKSELTSRVDSDTINLFDSK